MTKAESDLGAILDLLAEWTQGNRTDFTLVNVGANGNGAAHAIINGDVWLSAYKDCEPAGSNRTGSER